MFNCDGCFEFHCVLHAPQSVSTWRSSFGRLPSLQVKNWLGPIESLSSAVEGNVQKMPMIHKFVLMGASNWH